MPHNQKKKKKERKFLELNKNENTHQFKKKFNADGDAVCLEWSPIVCISQKNPGDDNPADHGRHLVKDRSCEQFCICKSPGKYNRGKEQTKQ